MLVSFTSSSLASEEMPVPLHALIPQANVNDSTRRRWGAGGGAERGNKKEKRKVEEERKNDKRGKARSKENKQGRNVKEGN